MATSLPDENQRNAAALLPTNRPLAPRSTAAAATGTGSLADPVVAPSVNPIQRGFNNVMFGGKTRDEYYGGAPGLGARASAGSPAPAPAPALGAYRPEGRNYQDPGARAPWASTPLVSRATQSSGAPTPAAGAGGFQDIGGGVFRRGNTFTDAAGTQDAAFLNRGAVSPQNAAAANSLVARLGARPPASPAAAPGLGAMPQPMAGAGALGAFDRAVSVRALTDLTSPEYRALRSLKMDADAEGKAMRQAGRGWRGGSSAGDAYQGMLRELTTGTREGQVAQMQDAGSTQRVGMQEAGLAQRAALGEFGATRRASMQNDVSLAELGVKRAESSLKNRASERLMQAQDAYASAQTPEERNAALQQLRAMGASTGEMTARERYFPVPGGQALTETGTPYSLASRVFDAQTGQFVGGGQAGGASMAAPRVGAVEGGYRYKGGDPSNQQNWEKI